MRKKYFRSKSILILFLAVFTSGMVFAGDISTGNEPVTGAAVDAERIIWGDVNGDRQVNIIDALMVARYYVGMIKTLSVPEAADVNADNVINIIDSLMIAQFYVGIIKEFPAETEPEPRPVPLDEKFRIQFGETVSVENGRLILSFVKVADSRCPSGVVCVRAGEAVIELQIEVPRGNQPESYTLKNPPNEPSVVKVWPFIISCLAVDPYPVYGQPQPPEAYIATLIVNMQPPPTPTPTPTYTQTPGPREVSLNEEFRITYGETVSIYRMATTISFVDIADSRCPQGVYCVWAGEAGIGLIIQRGSVEPLLYHIKNPPNEPSTVDLGSYSVSCLAVDPYPVYQKSIPLEDYVATLIVETK